MVRHESETLQSRGAWLLESDLSQDCLNSYKQFHSYPIQLTDLYARFAP